MQPKVRNARSEVFYISKSFRKAVALPSARTWRVKDADVAARGYILCMTKSKGFLFDKMTNLEPRLLTLTRNGLLIIYNKDDKGYVVDVKDAKVMTTKTDHFRTKRQTYRRCTMKLKFKYGSVSMIMFNEEIPMWRTAIATAHDGLLRSHLHYVGIHRKPPTTMQPFENSFRKDIEIAPTGEQPSTTKSPDGQNSAASITTCINAEGVIPAAQASSEVTVDMPEESEPITVIEAPRLVNGSAVIRLPNIAASPDDNTQLGTFDPSVCDSSYQWLHHETKLGAVKARKCISESSNSGLLTELTDDDMSKVESAKSVRCGYTSVATLRTRLEAKIQGKTVKKEKKPTHFRNSPLAMKKICNDNVAQTERLPPRKGTPLWTDNTSCPTPKTRRLGRSQSESTLEHTEMRRRAEIPATRSCDDSHLAAPFSERLGSTRRSPQDWHSSGVKLNKYYSNQWWAHSLRA